MSTTPGRNDPCPCGSGRKYKLCCGAAKPGSTNAAGAARAAAPVAGRRWSTKAKVILTIAVPLLAVLLLAWWDQRQKAAEEAARPKPWQYDAALNQHWDPEHGHWHKGPPPGAAPAGAPPTSTSPASTGAPPASAPPAPVAP